MKNFRFNTICNITQEPQELERYNRACRFIGLVCCDKMSSGAIKARFAFCSHTGLLSKSANCYNSTDAVCVSTQEATMKL